SFDESRLLETPTGPFRQALKLLEQRFVGDFEIEARLTLPARLQFFRQAITRPGIAINPHEMKAHVCFADLNPGHGDGRFLHLSAPGLQCGRAGSPFQTVPLRAVLGHREWASLLSQDAPQSGEDSFKLGGSHNVSSTRL